ncbi:unnamed protein product [Cylindrotheca closterium]|uniref:Uncharacterized protein n=1 Tax=Cylindrotheca closterium TaxID=2856 RepID=A0AAD2G2W0_9STRA|nr:unnamed protein product [Cylindrotheca closterium]
MNLHQFLKQLSLDNGVDSIAFVSDNARSPPRTSTARGQHLRRKRDHAMASKAHQYSSSSSCEESTVKNADDYTAARTKSAPISEPGNGTRCIGSPRSSSAFSHISKPTSRTEIIYEQAFRATQPPATTMRSSSAPTYLPSGDIERSSFQSPTAVVRTTVSVDMQPIDTCPKTFQLAAPSRRPQYDRHFKAISLSPVEKTRSMAMS